MLALNCYNHYCFVHYCYFSIALLVPSLWTSCKAGYEMCCIHTACPGLIQCIFFASNSSISAWKWRRIKLCCSKLCAVQQGSTEQVIQYSRCSKGAQRHQGSKKGWRSNDVAIQQILPFDWGFETLWELFWFNLRHNWHDESEDIKSLTPANQSKVAEKWVLDSLLNCTYLLKDV